MKKILLKTITLLIVLVCSIGLFAACNATLEELQSEYGIVVEGGGFKKGTTLVTEELDLSSNEAQTAIEAVRNRGLKGNMYVFDISALLDGAKVQPNGKVKVTMPAPDEGAIAYDVFHIKDSGACEKLVATYSNGKVSFETDSFSLFVLVEGKNEYKLSVNFSYGGSAAINDEILTVPYMGTIARNETVTLKAIKDEGYGFDGWYDIYGSVVSYSSEYTFTMDSDMYITAKYVGLVNVMFMAKEKDVVAIEGNFEYNGEIWSHVQRMWEIGTEYTIKAIPNYGYMFLYWEIEGKDVSSDPVYHGVVNGFPGDEFIALAVFEKTDYYLQVNAIGGGKIAADGEEESTVYKKGFYDACSVTLTAIKDEGYHFVGWYDEEDTCLSTSDSYQINVDGKKKLEARFEKDKAPEEEVTLTVTAGENGGVTKSYENGKKVEKGSSVTISAIPNDDYCFIGWFAGETKVSANETYTFTINEDTTLVAKFEKILRIYITINEKNGGYITQEGFKLEVGYSGKIELGAVRYPDSQITLVANANDGYYFVGWYENGNLLTKNASYSFPATEDRNLEADFEVAATEYRFLCDVQGNGSILENGKDVTDTYRYGKTLAADSKITLTASPDSYWGFKGWYESDGTSLISTNATYTFELPAHTSVCAIFEERPMDNFLAQCVLAGGEYNVVSDDGGYLTENGSRVDFENGRSVEPNTKITLTAVANEGYEFRGWATLDEYNCPVIFATESTHTFTVTESTYVQAIFHEKANGLTIDAHNAGFTYEDGKLVTTVYKIGDEIKPNIDYVGVYATYPSQDIQDEYLTLGEDYTRDLGGLDFTKVGIYTVTYKLISNPSLTVSLTVKVEA